MARIKKRKNKIDLSSRGILHDDGGEIQGVVVTYLDPFNNKMNIVHMMIQIYHNNLAYTAELHLHSISKKTVSMISSDKIIDIF